MTEVVTANRVVDHSLSIYECWWRKCMHF